MALLPIGIAENLSFVLDECKISEHGTLELTMQQGGAAMDIFDAFDADEAPQDPAKSKFIIYPPNTKVYGSSDDRPVNDIAKDLLNMRKAFLDYGMLFGTKAAAAEAFGGWKMFDGLGISQTKEARQQAVNRFNDESFLLQVYQNLCNKFLSFLKSRPKAQEVRFRHKFWRKSPTKAFPDLPAFYMKDAAVESADIPAEATKLSFSKWEISKGKNDATIPQPDNNSNTTATTTEPANLFQAPAATTPEDTDSNLFTADAGSQTLGVDNILGDS